MKRVVEEYLCHQTLEEILEENDLTEDRVLEELIRLGLVAVPVWLEEFYYYEDEDY